MLPVRKAEAVVDKPEMNVPEVNIKQLLEAGSAPWP